MFYEDDQFSAAAQQAMLLATKLTMSDRIDPEHVMIGMLDDARGPLAKSCLRQRAGLNLASLRETIVQSARDSTGSAAPTETWSDGLLSDRTTRVLRSLEGDSQWPTLSAERKTRLLAAGVVEAALPRVRRVVTHMGVDIDELLAHLRRPDTDALARPRPFDDHGQIDPQAFELSGRAILRLIESEGRGLGLRRIGTPLLLFALLSRKDGLLEQAMRLQAVDPRLAHQNLLLHLKSLGRGKFNEDLTLRQDAMQPAVVQAFQRACDLAFDMDLPKIGEAELAKGLIQQADSFVSQFLQMQKIDVGPMSSYLAHRHSGEEPDVPPDEKPLTMQEVEARLRQNIIGQDHVIDMIIPLLKRVAFKYPRPNRPVAVLLLLGQSGTGKTQLAKEIAKAIYGSEDSLIFLEMGQFGTDISKSIFVGAPPGYVGYGEGLLTNGLRDKPESVVLFDEIEKAHKTVFDVLLRFIDEGQIADPAGPIRDGRKCVIALTSNHALSMLQPLIEKQSRAERLPDAERESIRGEIRAAILDTEFFRPEFINRVDEMLLFNSFDSAAFRAILVKQLEEERVRMQTAKNFDVTFEDSIPDALVQKCLERSGEGARVCAKLISTLIVNPLIDYFLDPANAGVDAVTVSADRQGTLHFQATQSPATRR